eukprot:6075220-Lingulodinium_polyedra.AAC.1
MNSSSFCPPCNRASDTALPTTAAKARCPTTMASGGRSATLPITNSPTGSSSTRQPAIGHD